MEDSFDLHHEKCIFQEKFIVKTDITVKKIALALLHGKLNAKQRFACQREIII
jgi:hypothetical protein